jgi:hypothetical protein
VHPTTHPTPDVQVAGDAAAGAAIGARICLVAGLVWMLWGLGTLPNPLPVVFAAVVFVVAAGTFVKLRSIPSGGSPGSGFRTAYWVIVGLEVVAIGGGLVFLNRAIERPEATAGWIAFVVGVHFLALARLWPGRRLTVLGLLVATAGMAGLAAVALGADIDTATAIAALPTGAALLGSAAVTSRRLQGRVTG